MKLLKFRIQNYKSIKDSGWCYLASDMTILAGKNESGKSAILEALQNFNVNGSVPDDSIPIDSEDEPVIELCFEIDKLTREDITKELGMTKKDDAWRYLSGNTTIIKYNDGSYHLKDEISTEDKLEEINKILNIEILSEIEELSDVTKPEMEGRDLETIQGSVNEYVETIKANLRLVGGAGDRKKIQNILNNLEQKSSALESSNSDHTLLEKLKEHVPNFMFFSELDPMPFEVPFSEAKNYPAVQAFAKIANLDLDKVISSRNKQRRRNLLEGCSAKISGDFTSYWGQDQLELVATPDGENLLLGIKESGSTSLFKSQQRSKGLQWFLSFYLRLNAEHGEKNIILIDEPGFFLHAKAQKDVLKVLGKISKESQIIFSTHSPYLIDTEHLDRLRLVLKDNKNGTRVENKIHKNADAETLTPIITAIGLDISNQLSVLGNKKSVLLEGISDYYYLQGLSYCIETNNINFIPCTGAQRISQLVSLLIGWDLEFLVVLDNDKEGEKVRNELNKKLQLEENQIVFISDEKDSSVEDLFTHDDFNKFVLGETNDRNSEVKNSKFLKDNRGVDKVLLAKRFFEKTKNSAHKTELSKDTLDNFKRVFNEINSLL